MVMNSVASEKFITALTFKNFLNIRLLLQLPPQAISLTSSRLVKGRKRSCEVHSAHVRIITSVSLQVYVQTGRYRTQKPDHLQWSSAQTDCCFICSYAFLATDLKLWRIKFI